MQWSLTFVAVIVSWGFNSAVFWLLGEFWRCGGWPACGEFGVSYVVHYLFLSFSCGWVNFRCALHLDFCCWCCFEKCEMSGIKAEVGGSCGGAAS